jgi:hypothetical protein
MDWLLCTKLSLAARQRTYLGVIERSVLHETLIPPKYILFIRVHNRKDTLQHKMSCCTAVVSKLTLNQKEVDVLFPPVYLNCLFTGTASRQDHNFILLSLRLVSTNIRTQTTKNSF